MVELRLTNIASSGGEGEAPSGKRRERFFARDGLPIDCETVKPSVNRFKDHRNQAERFKTAFSNIRCSTTINATLVCFAQHNPGVAARWRSALNAQWRPNVCFCRLELLPRPSHSACCSGQDILPGCSPTLAAALVMNSWMAWLPWWRHCVSPQITQRLQQAGGPVVLLCTLTSTGALAGRQETKILHAGEICRGRRGRVGDV